MHTKQRQLQLTCGILLIFVSGCFRSGQSGPPPRSAANVGELKSKVIAQGQILPAGGIVRLLGAPGDIVDAVLVEAGQTVTAGQRLIRLRSESVSEAQLAVLNARRHEAKLSFKRTVAAAEQQVVGAKLKNDHLRTQRAQLEQNDKLLALAKKQVDSATKVMQQLEAISKDAVAGSFVGQIEIDRQKVSVGEAELNYQQQLQTQKKASEDLNFAKKAAQVELTVAEQTLASAQASTALDIIDLEIETLKKKLEAAQITAPTKGTILAVQTRRGEATTSFPLIEMADPANLVCEVEINEMDAAIVQEKQRVKIYSRAFAEPLEGTLTKKFSLVGRPQLRPLDPLARVDFRSVTAIVELDKKAAKKAKEWLQLQVEVEILTGKSTGSEEPTKAETEEKTQPQ